jgi:hypothetical protein
MEFEYKAQLREALYEIRSLRCAQDEVDARLAAARGEVEQRVTAATADLRQKLALAEHQVGGGGVRASAWMSLALANFKYEARPAARTRALLAHGSRALS